MSLCSDSSESASSKTIPVTINVIRGINLRGSKGDVMTSFVRVEHGSFGLGESPYYEDAHCSLVEYNFTCKLECCPDDVISLDNLVHKPLLLSVFEVLPKEKKQKERSVVLIGQLTVDLLPLLQGETCIKSISTIHPTPESPIKLPPADSQNASLELMVTTSEPLLPQEHIEKCNLLRVTVEAAFSVPDGYASASPQYIYAIALPMPVSSEKEIPLIMANGVPQSFAECKASPKPKCWPQRNIRAAGASHIQGTLIESTCNGHSQESKEFPMKAEMELNCISWYTERRCYLNSGAAASLQKSIADNRLWPVEIFRTTVPVMGKGSKGKVEKMEESLPISCHGVAFVDMASLLYPGAQRVHGVYQVTPYSDTALFEKTNRSCGVARDALQTEGEIRCLSVLSTLTSGVPRQAMSCISKDEKPPRDATSKARTRNMTIVKQTSELEFDGGESVSCIKAETQPYLEAETYIVLEFFVDKPFIHKRTTEELTMRVSELIPSRSALPKKIYGAQEAVQSFHAQIHSIADMLIAKYHDMLKEDADGLPNDYKSQEDRKSKLFYEFNSSGAYYAFKEQLKHSIIDIVREKYLKRTTFKDEDELHVFLSDLYVFLMDETHIVLNKIMSTDESSSTPIQQTTSIQLRNFAKDAEILGHNELAIKYLQEVLLQDKMDPEHWIDYGLFCLRTGDATRAEECFREAVAVDQNNVLGLILCGVMCVMDERYEEAEILLEKVTSEDPRCMLAWTVLGLVYTGQQNNILAELAFSEAQQTNPAAAIECSAQPVVDPAVKSCDNEQHEGGSSDVYVNTQDQNHRPQEGVTQDESKSERFGTPPRALNSLLQASNFLVEAHVPQVAERALSCAALELLDSERSEYHLILGKLHMLRGNFEQAELHLNKASQHDHKNPDTWAFMGHLYYKMGRPSQAQDCYERTCSFVEDTSEIHTVHLQLASIYLRDGQFKKAKQMYLLACKSYPSQFSCLGAGIACYRLGQLEEAEDALSEANFLDNSNAVVWGYLSLVCLKAGRRMEAEQSYKYAVKLHLQDDGLLAEIAQAQVDAGFGDPSY
uniref:cilia- and flagella-associated protein 70 n=1 Tax=Myxine glutinosa TaxID=7769 RepID=UPI00358E9253